MQLLKDRVGSGSPSEGLGVGVVVHDELGNALQKPLKSPGGVHPWPGYAPSVGPSEVLSSVAFKFLVLQRDTNLHHAVSAFSRPPHVLVIAHSSTYHPVDR